MNSIDSPATAETVAALVREGMTHHRAADLRKAEHAYRAALAIDRDHPEALALLGLIAGQTGQLQAATDLLQRALKRAPRNPNIHHNLGETWRQRGEYRLALQSFERAITYNPDHIEAYRCGAEAALAEAARLNAARHWTQVAEFKRIAAHLLVGASRRLRDAGNFAAASEASRQASEIDPASAEAWAQYGEILADISPSQAIPILRRAIELDPGDDSIRVPLCSALLRLYRLDEAQAQRRIEEKADQDRFQLQPHLDFVDSFALYTGGDVAEIVDRHRAWGVAAAKPHRTKPVRFENSIDPERPLRIGYVSPNLREHPVAHFLEPLIRARDPTRFTAVCYSTRNAATDDAATERLKAAAPEWRTVPPETDDESFRRLIRADRIDILIDLAGHTRDSRLRAFAQRPAPVTASWLGYPATTGLQTIDWRITDAIADPDGNETHYTEKLMRLDGGFLCYEPPASAPETTSPPALTSGRLTFGSFNNQLKINRDVIRAWSHILAAVPTARLIIKSHWLDDAGVSARLRDGFASEGIDATRLELRPWITSERDHLAAYHEIDIALDPFPYNGTTTTCEALSMGVPVVTLIGDRHSGRVGFDILSRIGLERFAARDVHAYVRVAATLANDRATLVDLRRDLRDRMRRSPLCDATRFVREFEAALRAMWRQWCNAAV